MKTTIQGDRGKSGVHQADENHNAGRPRKKWCSSRGGKPQSRKTEKKMVFTKQMNTTIQEGRGKNGVHQGDESQQSQD
ncbi:hypothetical protein [Niallia circulans]|uniref:hypothetical protein n=1 Tax=Niallia circulans TaxID=1397 RepID=UPI00155F84F2|nr:hypothetical protein [Niallia circulans]NRG35052.1 hypothetical protein [Niallia circulans]